ncbi:hypothetical protein B4086_5587 [Bacillus cereus]|nr:hypothetical protein B4086_5587 [Bacillus cereus]
MVAIHTRKPFCLNWNTPFPIANFVSLLFLVRFSLRTKSPIKKRIPNGTLLLCCPQ